VNIAGIDPDASGGVALLSPSGVILGTWTAPTRSGKWHPADARRLFAEVAVFGPFRVSIESAELIWVNASKRTGRSGLGAKKSTRYKGVSPEGTRGLALMVGRYEGMLTQMGVDWVTIRPQEWQKPMHKRVPGADTKARSINAARLAHPSIDLQPGRRQTDQHGVADAWCIAEYERRRLDV